MLRYNISSQSSEAITSITAQGNMKYADSIIYIMDKSQIELLSYTDTANVANLQQDTITPAGSYKMSGFSTSSVVGLIGAGFTITGGQGDIYSRELDYKRYELKDHLGNVRVVISDIKEPDGNYDQFTADLKSYYNYYSFGMLMTGRIYNEEGYNFGYQSSEVEKYLHK